jgi:hypothetical protein
VLPAPEVHADLAPAAALAVAHEHRAGAGLKVVLGQSERLIDAQPGAPEQHDQRAHPRAVDAVAGQTHDRDDLLDRGRIGRVAQPLLLGGRPARYPGGVTGERRRPAAFSSGGADMDSPLGGRLARPDLHGARCPVRNPEGCRRHGSPPVLQLHRSSTGRRRRSRARTPAATPEGRLGPEGVTPGLRPRREGRIHADPRAGSVQKRHCHLTFAIGLRRMGSSRRARTLMLDVVQPPIELKGAPHGFGLEQRRLQAWLQHEQTCGAHRNEPDMHAALTYLRPLRGSAG